MMRLRVAATTLLLLTSGCASTPPLSVTEVQSAAERWRLLNEFASSSTTLRSHANVRIEQGGERKRFKANLAVDSSRMRLDLLTPLGTTAATLYAEEDRLLLLNHLEQTYWEGGRTELRRVVPALGPFLEFGARSGYLVLGLPSGEGDALCTAAADRQVCKGVSGLSYLVASSGLERVNGGEVEVTFNPPQFPPSGVRISDGGNVLTIEHLEIVQTKERVKGVKRPVTYRCCAVSIGEQ